jgi:hypothetical protein
MVHIFYPESIGLYLLWGGYLVLAICIMVWARAGYYSASKFEAHPALQSFKYGSESRLIDQRLCFCQRYITV